MTVSVRRHALQLLDPFAPRRWTNHYSCPCGCVNLGGRPRPAPAAVIKQMPEWVTAKAISGTFRNSEKAFWLRLTPTNESTQVWRSQVSLVGSGLGSNLVSHPEAARGWGDRRVMGFGSKANLLGTTAACRRSECHDSALGPEAGRGLGRAESGSHECAHWQVRGGSRQSTPRQVPAVCCTRPVFMPRSSSCPG